MLVLRLLRLRLRLVRRGFGRVVIFFFSLDSESLSSSKAFGGHVGGVYIAALCCLLLCARSLAATRDSPTETQNAGHRLDQPLSRKKKLQTLFYIYKNITVAVARHEGCFVRVCVCVCVDAGRVPPFVESSVEYRQIRCYM